METISTQQEPARRPFFAVYVGLWCLLAVTALGYLTLLSTRPDLIASLFGTDPQYLAQQRSDGRHTIPTLVTELTRTRTTLARVEQDLADSRAALVDRDRRIATLETRLAAVESRITALADAAKPEPSVAQAQQPASSSAAPAKQAKSQEAPAPATSSSWETASIKTAQSDAKEAASVSGRSLGLGLSRGPSLDALRLNWQLLQERHADTLGSLEARYVRSERRPHSYRLVVGPVGTAEEARRICDSIKLPRTGCSILSFGGKPL